jgi:anti-sigma-K factor RskA
MTKIEERLQDALQASAARVRDDRLRPLPAAEPGAERRAIRRQAWRAWLIPAAAAASVLLVVAVVVAVTRHTTEPATQQSTSQVAMPSYFVRWVGNGPSGRIEVRSVSTGAVIATVPPPKSPLAGALDIEAVAAAPDDRTFYVEYGVVGPNPSGNQIWIFSFSLTGSGSVTPQTMIKGGRITNQTAGLQTWGNLAVSPDGTKLALTADSIDGVPVLAPAYSDKIIVIDLVTGQRTQWQGGLDRRMQQFSIQDLSWSADGRSLIFLGRWCDLPGPTDSCAGVSARGGYSDAQVWSLSVATGGGPLTRGRLLLRQSARFPLIAQALGGPGGPGGSDLTVGVVSGQVANDKWRVLTVEDVSAATGAVLHVDYGLSLGAGQGRSPEQVWLAADPSGQHLLVSYAVDGGFTIGWIGHGAVHRLPIAQPYLPNNATLIIAW